MTYGTSLALIAIGAVLRFAVTASVSGFSIQTAGTILMVIGVIGFVVSLLYSLTYARRRDAVLVERPVVQEPRRRVRR